MGGHLVLLLFLLLPSLAESVTLPPPPSPYEVIDRTRCIECPIPPTPKHCGTKLNPQCALPFSMPYKGQNHMSTCARLRCPDNYDMFVNTVASGANGDRIVDYTPRRVVLNPQTAICARESSSIYKFKIRDGEGFMRPVNDVQCRQNNFPRHSCVTDGFLKQSCTKTERCSPINFLSDYGGNKCNEPFQLMMRFSEAANWQLMKKLSCDRELGWWRIHFPNGTWMHTRYGTIATCVTPNGNLRSKSTTESLERIVSLVARGLAILVISLVSLLVCFNAYMCRSVVIWEGSNWKRLWRQDLFEQSKLAVERDTNQEQIVTGMKTQAWHEYYQRGLFMDLRQYDIMQNCVGKTDYVHNMRHWTMLDDFDMLAQQEEANPSPSYHHLASPAPPRPPPDLLTPEVAEVTAPAAEAADAAAPPPPAAAALPV
ncbi:hypothetical protein PENTCL1PPCAC_13840 [Pristionchus entomophagus]|uniref:Uncharacterized protein n=1 Tax=Pristionchus entomophagus TaxID=358040 RepID=A0AAV5TFA3_9BILA|nr:hypothetical protein PENTCL1PPCAC_13840 [Pristionchus entomophagus]